VKPNIDFSILEEKQPATIPTGAREEDGQYKTTHDTVGASQALKNAIQGIQEIKREVLQGVRSGADPYQLLLKAIEGLSIFTGDKAFYAINRDVMQGMGQLGGIPSEWEREGTEASLQRLEAARRNIDVAITAHRQRINGQPIGELDEYTERIRQCFEAAFKFINVNKCARTYEDWERIVESLSQYIDPLIIDLIVAAVNEIEREYKTVTIGKDSE